jgi:hypothetical protein
VLYRALHASNKNSKCAPKEDTRSEYFYSVASGCDERVATNDAEVVAIAAAQHSASKPSSDSSNCGGVGPKNKDLQTVA